MQTLSEAWRARATLAVLVFVTLCCALVATRAAALPVCSVGHDSDLSCARGFEGREQDKAGGFRWSDGDSTLLLGNSGFGQPWALSIALRSGRPADSAPVAAALAASGRVWRLAVGPLPRQYRLLLPGSMLGTAQVRLLSDTFAPGSGRRTLGLIVSEARQLPLPGTRLPDPLFVLALLALGLAGHTFQYRAQQNTSMPAQFESKGWQMYQPLALGLAVIGAGAGLVVLLPLAAFYLPAASLFVSIAVLVWCRTANRCVRAYTTSLSHQVYERSNPSVAAYQRPFTPAVPPLRVTSVDVTQALQCAATRWLWGAALAGCLLDGLVVTLGNGPAWRAPLLLILQAAVVLAACTYAARLAQPPSLTTLLGAALLLRLGGIATRLLSGNTYLDADVELFYAYGMALRQIGLPEIEYPSGALLTWAALTWLAGESRERFALLLPLQNLFCDLGIVAALVTLGRRSTSEWAGSLAAACFALSPMLLPFVFAKYDSLPTLLLLGGVALFATGASPTAPHGRSTHLALFLAGLLLGLGGTTKWVPLLAVPALGLYLLGTKRVVPLAAFGGGVLLGTGLPSLPFVLSNLDAFLAPYRLQGGRPMTGQSVWFLIALFFEPALLKRLPRAWSGVHSDVLPVAAMVAGQGLVLITLLALSLQRPPLLRRTLARYCWRTWERGRPARMRAGRPRSQDALAVHSPAVSLALALLLPCAFLLLNRVYSPQYMVTISAALLGALALTAPERPVRWYLLLLVAQAANLLVWPLFSPYWLWASATMFLAALGLVGLLAVALSYRRVRGSRASRNPSPT